ncbi:type VI secretion system baseplate subunit TssG [Pragia fontium]|uniref:Type VI secretion system protein ImpH n=2 Tax=Pragia fontium TaxID=82985 RepID=A0AAJ5BG79_9GAMM|nr:type VI secretion system baseplate subunit TssG [Pragia fontium]AKJ41623.1 hypothetical protein QQ39_05600 [Pragia fontium]SFC31155.1 type VI secretion system protein ImpH [Pragia fontium DSM 5563 = ATCC 49100]SUB81847.1 Uncharacterized protein conserved in bacteria [Pragia fontium]VEJ54407.1 Uncharacterized protein conserved in bacteria [Pragia fontium]GKX63150.1 type VI secretion protein [Pragia fontium]
MVVDEYLVPEQAEKYNFYQLIELLAKSSGTDIDNLLNLPPDKESIRFISNPSLAFVTRDISSVTVKDNKVQIKLPFLSLTGTHSPLPNYYLEGMAWEEIQQDYRLTALLDLFNHRLATYLYKVWRKYRYYICYSHSGQDEFSQRMFALVGLGKVSIRQSLQVNQSKMLSYAGILASAGRSPHLMASLIAHCFDLSNVNIESWQFRRVPIPQQQQNRIGQANAVLGENLIIGTHIPDYSGKFTLTISELSREKMEQFLPTGSLHHALHNFVSFILRDQFAWDLQLVLGENQIDAMTLGENTGCYLGWTTFLQEPPSNPSTMLKMQE